MREQDGRRRLTSPDSARRTIRVEDDLWEQASRIAEANETTLSAIIRAGLRRYVKANRARLDGTQ